jgi:hypothetical protein
MSKAFATLIGASRLSPRPFWSLGTSRPTHAANQGGVQTALDDTLADGLGHYRFSIDLANDLRIDSVNTLAILFGHTGDGTYEAC